MNILFQRLYVHVGLKIARVLVELQVFKQIEEN